MSDLLDLADADLEQVDIIDVNLAVAQQLSECRNLDMARFKKTVDEWAAWVKHEVDRHSYRFKNNPAEYKNSKAYFCALMMRTVLDQDYHIRYDLEDFSFEKPEDLFVHGVLDERKGTCLSLPVLQIAIGQRLGWPIRAVAVPGHTFCRWDDPQTGERLNIEAANTQGLVDHDDAYYRHWPFELQPRWEAEFGALKSMTMREHLACMIGALGSHFAAKKDYPSALRWDAMAHWLNPQSRDAFIVLRGSIDQLSPRYLDPDELAGRKDYLALNPNPSMNHNTSVSKEKPEHNNAQIDLEK